MTTAINCPQMHYTRLVYEEDSAIPHPGQKLHSGNLLLFTSTKTLYNIEVRAAISFIDNNNILVK